MNRSFQVNTCVIHRCTLLDKTFCYKCGSCNKQNNLKCILTKCLVCNDISSNGDLCRSCFCCTGCFRFNRISGICKFCSHGVFNENSTLGMYRKFPEHMIKIMFAIPGQEFDTINKFDNKTVDAKNIIKLIVSFL